MRRREPQHCVLDTRHREFADVPADRAKALQEAFLAAHRNPEFLADAARMGIEISPIGADAMARGIARLGEAPPSVVAYMQRADDAALSFRSEAASASNAGLRRARFGFMSN